MASSDGKPTLTIEEIRENPLALLNADEKGLRAFLRERIATEIDRPAMKNALREALSPDPQAAREEEVEQQVELAIALLDAFRRAFTAITREDLAAEELSEAATALRERWRAVRGPVTDDFYLLRTGERPLAEVEQIEEAISGEDNPRLLFHRFSCPAEEGHHAWFALRLSHRENAWEQLADKLETTLTWLPQTVLVCPICGTMKQRGRSDQVYCSRACANLAWQREHRGGQQ